MSSALIVWLVFGFVALVLLHELTHVIQQTGSPPLQTKKLEEAGAPTGSESSIQRICTACAADDRKEKGAEPNANAYTVGHNIVFGTGRFAPGTHEGRRLIAHELTHVVQQSGNVSPKIQRQPDDDKKKLPVR